MDLTAEKNPYGLNAYRSSTRETLWANFEPYALVGAISFSILAGGFFRWFFGKKRLGDNAYGTGFGDDARIPAV
ncbi:hypothetical protein [Hafnia alvei]|uniref:hypothetical protein n=1 Tax=Hafnia alvei TaxID=569 RepID=UPI0020BECEB8|nr:hypothetical protein [Hafnia alvei]